MRIYGTWVDDNGVRHYASGVKRDEGLLGRGRGAWVTNVFCGNYIDVEPRDPKAVVTCFRCLWKKFQPFNPSNILRGPKTDLVCIDEAQDIDLEKIGLFSLQPAP